MFSVLVVGSGGGGVVVGGGGDGGGGVLVVLPAVGSRVAATASSSWNPGVSESGEGRRIQKLSA